ncbi:hypothetical protein LXL04_032329 [Taraxacum kok-saghyz]
MKIVYHKYDFILEIMQNTISLFSFLKEYDTNDWLKIFNLGRWIKLNPEEEKELGGIFLKATNQVQKLKLNKPPFQNLQMLMVKILLQTEFPKKRRKQSCEKIEEYDIDKRIIEEASKHEIGTDSVKKEIREKSGARPET